jgi:hypothetical protein
MLIGNAIFVLVSTSLAFQVQIINPMGGTLGGFPQNGPPRTPPATDCAASGTVVNALTGQPIVRAMVTMGGGNSGAATDSNGQWSVTNVTCGRFVPSASRPGFLTSNQGPQSIGMQPQIIQLVSGSPVRDIKISLMPEGSITGKVQDRNGEPIESAQIRALRVQVQNGVRMMNNAAGGSSDVQGNFRLGGLGTGRYIVCATSNQTTYPVGGGSGLVYQEDCYPGPVATGVSNAVPLEGGREMRVSLTLAELPGVHIRGTVSGAPTTGPGRGNVQLMRQSNGGGRGAPILPDGTFDLVGVAPGSYTVRANFPSPPGPVGRGGQDTAVAQVEVREADINGLVLAVQPPGSVTGTVRFELSNPQTPPNPNVNVNMNPAPVNGMIIGGSFPGQPQWDAAHLGFSFPEVQAGEYRINVGTPAMWVKSMTLRGQDILNVPFAVDGTTGPVEIVLSDQTGDLDISITDKDGQPAGGGVILKPSHGQTIMMRVAESGHITRKGLPVGDYTVWAFDDVNMVPWAENDWMTRYAGPSEKISIVQGNTSNLTMKRTVAPNE